MFSFIAIVVLVTATSAAVVPSLNMPRPNSTLHLSAPTARKTSRIINGQEADPNDFPHQLTLLYNGYHICGASLLSQNWAITAAHCVEGGLASSFDVAGGFLDFSNPGQYFYISVRNIHMHNRFNQGPGGFPNDIALLELASHSYDLRGYTIGLPGASADFTNARCFISGWGVTESGDSPNHLMKSEVSALTNAKCQETWGSNILSQHICILGEQAQGSGSCNGDSGGPLTCNGVLAGLTSWGRSGCHDSGVVTYPSVYVRTSYFLGWILDRCYDCV